MSRAALPTYKYKALPADISQVVCAKSGVLGPLLYLAFKRLKIVLDASRQYAFAPLRILFEHTSQVLLLHKQACTAQLSGNFLVD